MGVANHYAEFVDLVARMRKAQHDYFRDRTSEKLFEARRLESAVDENVQRYMARQCQPLFQQTEDQC